MGCNSSKQEVQEITKEDRRPEIAEAGIDAEAGKDVGENSKAARVFTPVSTIDENINGESKILEEPVHQKANKTTNNSVEKNIKQPQPSHQSGVLNAWNAAPRGKAKPLKSIDYIQGMRNDTEYDKEGIDIYSTSLTVNTNMFFASCSSPDDVQVSGEEPHKCTVPSKAETEEAFNPSIIDIEKFKAANAPSSKKAHLFSDTTYSSEGYHPYPPVVTGELRSSAGSSKKAGTWPASMDLVSPSDSNFYNEDEKELIENIEREYLGPQNILPGAVRC